MLAQCATHNLVPPPLATTGMRATSRLLEQARVKTDNPTALELFSSIKQIAEKQKIISATLSDQDVIAFAEGSDETCMQVFIFNLHETKEIVLVLIILQLHLL